MPRPGALRSRFSAGHAAPATVAERSWAHPDVGQRARSAAVEGRPRQPEERSVGCAPALCAGRRDALVRHALVRHARRHRRCGPVLPASPSPAAGELAVRWVSAGLAEGRPDERVGAGASRVPPASRSACPRRGSPGASRSHGAAGAFPPPPLRRRRSPSAAPRATRPRRRPRRGAARPVIRSEHAAPGARSPTHPHRRPWSPTSPARGSAGDSRRAECPSSATRMRPPHAARAARSPAPAPAPGRTSVRGARRRPRPRSPNATTHGRLARAARPRVSPLAPEGETDGAPSYEPTNRRTRRCPRAVAPRPCGILAWPEDNESAPEHFQESADTCTDFPRRHAGSIRGESRSTGSCPTPRPRSEPKGRSGTRGGSDGARTSPPTDHRQARPSPCIVRSEAAVDEGPSTGLPTSVGRRSAATLPRRSPRRESASRASR